MPALQKRPTADRRPKAESLGTAPDLLARSHNLTKLLSVQEAVALTGISRGSLYKALGRGALVGVKVGRRLLLPPDNIHAYLAALPKATFNNRESRLARKNAA